MKLRLSHILPILVAIAFSSCEKEVSDTIDNPLNSPFISSLELRSSFVNLDTTSGSIVKHNLDGSYTVSDTAVARVSDPSGVQAIQNVNYFLFSPDQSDYFGTGQMQLIGSSDGLAIYRIGFSFTLRRPDIGAYRIEVSAENRSNLTSNSLTGSVTISRNNIPPRIFNLSAPDTLIRPNSGRRPVFFAVSAFDSDGAGDISSVFFKSVNSSNPNFEFKLYDDGNLDVTGDSVAGDGRYSLLIPIDSTATLGTKEFRFWARDKSSALSDSLVHFITIIPSPE